MRPLSSKPPAARTSGPCMPEGGSSGVPGAALNPPLPSPSRTETLPIPPGGMLPHLSPQSALARSGKPSLLKSAVTSLLGLVVLVGMLMAGVNATPAPAGAAQHNARRRAHGSARDEGR